MASAFPNNAKPQSHTFKSALPMKPTVPTGGEPSSHHRRVPSGIVEAVSVVSVLQTIPPVAVYLVVAAVVGVESLGIPLPGEIVLVTAAVLSSRHELHVNPVLVGAAGVIGAVVGDSTGYAVGRRLGMPLFDWLGRRFPKHFGAGHVALAERVFDRAGTWAVFLGRFIALLRIFAGPLAGALKMRYPRFLAANVSGAVCWAGGTTALVYVAGVAAERWLTRFSWIALAFAVLCGGALAFLLRKRITGAVAEYEAPTSRQSDETTA
jgi:membrane protein DedA with SNARE-associated domain